MTASNFDASKYLTNLRGKEYLEVKWRLLWLRTQHPDATIETELVKHDAGLALFRARVSVTDGGSATGWGSETVDDFGDFIEKAETKALGRALAALGFGTQFCEDFNFAAEHGNGSTNEPATRGGPVVDAPVARGGLKAVRDGEAVASSGADAAHARRRGEAAPRDESAFGTDKASATSSQINAILAIARDHHALGESNVEERCRTAYGCLPGELSKQQASEFIVQLRRPGERIDAKQANRRQRQPV